MFLYNIVKKQATSFKNYRSTLSSVKLVHRKITIIHIALHFRRALFWSACKNNSRCIERSTFRFKHRSIPLFLALWAVIIRTSSRIWNMQICCLFNLRICTHPFRRSALSGFPSGDKVFDFTRNFNRLKSLPPFFLITNFFIPQISKWYQFCISRHW